MRPLIYIRYVLFLSFLSGACTFLAAEDTGDDLTWLDQYNVVWNTQSKNSSESMPVGGHDIGLNVWVEDGELMIYLARAGCYDENGALLKLGRVRMNLEPNPFEGDGFFHQELKLREGYVEIRAGQGKTPEATVRIWAEVHRPVAHVEIDAEQDISVTASYETWRHEDMELPSDPSKYARRGMVMMDYDQYPGKVKVYRDIIEPGDDGVVFYHRNSSVTVFDHQVRQQELEAVRDTMYDRLACLTFGGLLTGDNLAADGITEGEYANTPFRGWRYKSKTSARHHHLGLFTHIEQSGNIKTWENGLNLLAGAQHPTPEEALQRNLEWWDEFWKRSWIVINPDKAGTDDAGWQVGRNYNLFRYMLASNLFGRGATPFNGGLFTFHPRHTEQKRYKIDPEESGWTPDHRQWGAGLTQQNQRMVYWPMLKSGDFDLMPPGFSFYQSGMVNATARVRHYWDHNGCAFAEQPSITGLPGGAMYGHLSEGELRRRPENLNTESASGMLLSEHPPRRRRPEDLEPGVEVNPAGGSLFDSQLDWAWMMLEYHRFTGIDITSYLPFIEQAVIFYDEHYRFRNKQRNGKELDEDGKLVIYPANTLEHHPNALNPSLPIIGLHQILTRLLELPEKYCPAQRQERWREILGRLPDLPITQGGERRILKPAENYSHRSWHMPEMYGLWPFQVYGPDLPDLELMQNTFLNGGVSNGHREDVRAWSQGFIHYARLGMAEKAREKAIGKLGNGPYRFPAFWPEDIDWTPDFNWGGAGMIGLQEMLLQTHLPAPASLHGHALADGLRLDASGGENLRLLPAWPKDWDVDFKLYAPQQTVVEAEVRHGKVIGLKVTPESRRKDVILTKSLRKPYLPTYADVSYGPHATQVLDFWQASGDGPRPLLVFIHGGGWTSGDKQRADFETRFNPFPFDDFRLLNEKEISYASINYRLVDQASLPAPVYDAARAIQFLRTKADDWNIDKKRIALTGGSAGACTAMWILLHDDLANPKAADPVQRESSRVIGAAVRNGQTSIDPKVAKEWLGPNVLKHRMIWRAVGEKSMVDALKNYNIHKPAYIEFSPINHLTKDDPPLFMYYVRSMKLPASNAGHGIHHPVQGLKMKEKADNLGVECYLKVKDTLNPEQYSSMKDFLIDKLTENEEN